jgi:hypothetical protein
MKPKRLSSFPNLPHRKRPFLGRAESGPNRNNLFSTRQIRERYQNVLVSFRKRYQNVCPPVFDITPPMSSQLLHPPNLFPPFFSLSQILSLSFSFSFFISLLLISFTFFSYYLLHYQSSTFSLFIIILHPFCL